LCGTHVELNVAPDKNGNASCRFTTTANRFAAITMKKSHEMHMKYKHTARCTLLITATLLAPVPAENTQPILSTMVVISEDAYGISANEGNL
jgi:hypothetical protein